jgi:hypothetical protein
MNVSRACVVVAALFFALAPGCLPIGPIAGFASDAGPGAAENDAGTSDADAGHSNNHIDAGPSQDGTDAGSSGVERRTCTNTFGNALSTSFGRLDGTLVAVVPPGTHGCNSDRSHLHLQVAANGGVYDVAIALVSELSGPPEVSVLQTHAPLGNEGFHRGVRFSYTQDLGAHDTDFTGTPESTLETEVTAALAQTGRISVYGSGYGPTGMHKIHRDHGDDDGALVIDPESDSPTFFAFHFATQSF